MTLRLFAIVVLVSGLAAPPAHAQSGKAGKRAVFEATAISGLPSSAKHCVSGTSSNVHGIGWIEAGSRVEVTFLSDFDPIAGIVLMSIDTAAGRAAYAVDDDSGGNLEPQLSFVSTFSGNAALYVSGYRSTSGCYWYKLEVTPPGQTALGPAAPRPDKGVTFSPTAITGSASISHHCIAGDGVTNIHSIGRVTANSRILITFDTDFDAIAAITNLDLLAATPRPTYAIDDDGGGRLAPQLQVTTSAAGTIALFVGGYRSTAGCYRFKVEFQ
ncbi:MAG: hypothetical protein FJW14_16980 [Acidimicrobiia bacterium]|nr:hypothetical protein [Acidimicrobiia bacterium]